MNTSNLLKKLQNLRLKLYEIAEARGSLTDPDVLAISEEADRLIVALQQIHKKQHPAAGCGSPAAKSLSPQLPEKLR